MTVHACTIVARNTLPQVRVLGETFLHHHPDGTLTALVIDDLEDVLDVATEPFRVLGLEQLGSDPDLARMAALYQRAEFAAALKPWLLEHLLGEVESVLYLDPDTLVAGPLDGLSDQAAQWGIVLTPHTTSPLPPDGLLPSEDTLLGVGVFDLGFLGVGRGGLGSAEGEPSFLSFWKDHLRRECVVDPAGMRYLDQRVIDLVPALFRHAVVSDPTCAVSFWNLDRRELTVDPVGSGFLVDGAPLTFVHLSGFDPDERGLLSAHQGNRPRVRLSEQPALRRLTDHYADRLVFHGHGRLPDRPWTYDTMANGVPIDRYVRHIYGDALRAADRGDDVYPPVPWDHDGAEELCAWLAAPPRHRDDPGRLSLYLASVFGLDQAELRPHFFDPQFADRDRFVAWARSEAEAGRLIQRLVTEGANHPAVVAATSDAPSPWVNGGELRPGMLVAGYLRAELGVGEGARLLIASLEAAAIPHATFVFTRTSSRQEHPFESTGRDATDLDIAVVCVNADHLAPFSRSVGSGFFQGRHVVGQWAWELEEFPDTWPASFDLVDEIWAVSEFARNSIAAATDKPVFALPHAIVAPVVPPGVGRRELGLPDHSFVFLFTLDLLSMLERKNPLGLIEAYRSAFTDDGRTTLVLKVINGDQDVIGMERIRVAADRKDIIVLEEYLDRGDLAALMDTADCYVSLHRSEGFGLSMGEAMALGKPVIATGYSGNLDFMDDDTAYLVPWTAGSVPEGCDPYPAGFRWADPDLGAAAALMRTVFEHPEEARVLGMRARASVLAHHGPDARAEFLKRRFAAIESARENSRTLSGQRSLSVGKLRRNLARALRSDRINRYPKAAADRLDPSGDPATP